MGVPLSEVQPSHHELEIPVALSPHNIPAISVLGRTTWWTTSKKTPNTQKAIQIPLNSGGEENWVDNNALGYFWVKAWYDSYYS